MNEDRLKLGTSHWNRRHRALTAIIAVFSAVTTIGRPLDASAQPAADDAGNAPSKLDSPSSAPSPDDTEHRGSRRWPGSGFGKNPGRSDDPRDAQQGRRWPGVSPTLPSDEEWAEIGAFMEEHSKVRWALAKRSLSEPGRSDLPRRVIYAEYLELKRLQNSDPAEFKQRVGQIELEDDIFQAESLLRDAEVKQSADVSDLRSAFEAKVKEHFDRELNAKEARIGRLESQLREQREALENEKVKASQTLQQRIEIARKLSDWFRSWANGNIRLPFPRQGARPEDGTRPSPDAPPADAAPERE